MRFAIVGPAYPLRGGIAHHVYSLYQGLKTRGHTVQVISYKNLYPKLLFPGKTTIDTSSTVRLDAEAAPILDPIDPRTWLKAFRFINSFSADLTLVQWWTPFFGPMLGTLGQMLVRSGRKTVVECHNVVPHERTLFDALVTGLALAPAREFITHSFADREDLARLIPDVKIFVAPLPTATEFRSTTDSDRSGRTILFFGMIRKYKGLDVLLRAMAKVVFSVKCELIIAGEFYEGEDKYRRLVEDLSLAPYIKIENRYVPNEEVTSLFDRADVLVLPYLTATQSAVAQISLSNALPVIASRTGGLTDVIRDDVNGLLVRPADPDALAAAILRYFEEGMGPKLAKRLSCASDDDQASTITDLLEELAGDHARG